MKSVIKASLIVSLLSILPGCMDCDWFGKKEETKQIAPTMKEEDKNSSEKKDDHKNCSHKNCNHDHSKENHKHHSHKKNKNIDIESSDENSMEK